MESPTIPGAATDAGAATPAEPAGKRTGGVARAVFALVAVAALAALLWPRGSGERQAPAGGFLVDGGGRPTPLARELKAATLVHFWSTWCPPCLTEIPVLVAFGRERSDERFGVVLVAVDDSKEAAERFLGTSPFPLLFDPDWDVAHRFGTEKLPETHLLVGGKVVESFVGATDWADPAVRARIERHLKAAG